MTSPRRKHASLPPTEDSPEGKPPRGDRPRIEVRMLEVNPDGNVEELSTYPLDYYGTCPNVGDTIVANYFAEPTFYSVQRRYFVKESPLFAGWALIVRKIDSAGPPEELWREWQSATKFWDEVAEQEEEEERQARQAHIETLRRRIDKQTEPSKPQSTIKKPRRRPRGDKNT